MARCLSDNEAVHGCEWIGVNAKCVKMVQDVDRITLQVLNSRSNMLFEGGITMPIKEVVEFYSSTERRFPPDGGEANCGTCYGCCPAAALPSRYLNMYAV